MGFKELLCNLVSEGADKGFVLIAPFNILTLTNSHDADLDKKRLLYVLVILEYLPLRNELF